MNDNRKNIPPHDMRNCPYISEKTRVLLDEIAEQLRRLGFGPTFEDVQNKERDDHE